MIWDITIIHFDRDKNNQKNKQDTKYLTKMIE